MANWRVVLLALAGVLGASCSLDFTSGSRAPDLSDATRWEFFDLATAPSLGMTNRNGIGAQAFDGTYVYFFPNGGTVVTRFDTRRGFDDLDGWSSAALGAPFSTSSAVVCGNHLFAASANSSTLVHLALGGSFTFDMVPTVSSGGGLPGFAGAACASPKVYFAPKQGAAALSHDIVDGKNEVGPGGSFLGATKLGDHILFVPGLARSGALFTSSADWNAGSFTLTTVGIGNALTFDGATYDGHFAYLGTAGGESVVRVDATGNPATEPWEVGPVTAPPRARGGVFDGRFVYFSPGNGTAFLRYDTFAPFAASSSFTTFDIARLANVPPAPNTFGSAGFDGKYVYFAPVGTSHFIARLRTDATAMPDSFSGSFY